MRERLCVYWREGGKVVCWPHDLPAFELILREFLGRPFPQKLGDENPSVVLRFGPDSTTRILSRNEWRLSCPHSLPWGRAFPCHPPSSFASRDQPASGHMIASTYTSPADLNLPQSGPRTSPFFLSPAGLEQSTLLREQSNISFFYRPQSDPLKHKVQSGLPIIFRP